MREPYLRAVAAHTGFGYRRLDGADALYVAMSDPRLGQRMPVQTDFRWCPALGALVLLLVRFLPLPKRVRGSLRIAGEPVTAGPR